MELVTLLEEVPWRERKSCGWIRDGTWRLLDQRSALRKQGRLTMVQGRRLGRRIRASLQSDRDYRALQAGHAIMANLADDNIKAAWEHLRAWHKEVDPAASKPCFQALDRQTDERVALYRRRDPPGAPIPSSARRTP